MIRESKYRQLDVKPSSDGYSDLSSSDVSLAYGEDVAASGAFFSLCLLLCFENEELISMLQCMSCLFVCFFFNARHYHNRFLRRIWQ